MGDALLSDLASSIGILLHLLNFYSLSSTLLCSAHSSLCSAVLPELTDHPPCTADKRQHYGSTTAILEQHRKALRCQPFSPAGHFGSCPYSPQGISFSSEQNPSLPVFTQLADLSLSLSLWVHHIFLSPGSNLIRLLGSSYGLSSQNLLNIYDSSIYFFVAIPVQPVYQELLLTVDRPSSL